MEILAQNWEMLSLTFLFVKLWVHFSAKPSDHWPDAVPRFLFVFVGCNQSGQLLTMDQLLRAATQRNRQIFLRRNCYNALQRVSHFQTKIQTLLSEQLPEAEFTDWFLPGKSFCLDHGHSSTIILKELKGLNLVESFPRHLCIVASLSSKPPQSPLAPFASVFLAPLLPCWVLICLWQSWHHHRSARSNFSPGCRRNVKNLGWLSNLRSFLDH